MTPLRTLIVKSHYFYLFLMILGIMMQYENSTKYILMIVFELMYKEMKAK